MLFTVYIMQIFSAIDTLLLKLEAEEVKERKKKRCRVVLLSL